MRNEQVSETAKVDKQIKNTVTCTLCCSKIPIAITRVRTAPGEARRGAVGKLELTKRNDKQLKSKETLTSRSVRTVKKIPNFKKLHKQFEAHIARVRDKCSRDS